MMMLLARGASGCMIILCTAVAEARQDRTVIEAWIAERSDPALAVGVPIDLEWELERQPLRSREDLEARFDSLAEFPDHPDRFEVENQLNLLEHGRPLRHRLVYAGPRAWYYSFEMPIGDRVVLHAGGLGSTRWMLLDHSGAGQLTVVPAGHPFPVSSNVGRFLVEAQRHLRFFLSPGLPPSPASIEKVSVQGSAWEAILREGLREYRIEGGFDAAWGHPFVKTSAQYNTIGFQVGDEFSSQAWVDDLDQFIPHEASRFQVGTEYLDVYRLASVGVASRSTLSRLAARPDADRLAELGVAPTIVDFGDPTDRVAQRLLETGETATWSPSDEPRLLAGVERARRAGDSEDGAAGRWSGGVVLAGAVLAAATVLLGVVVIRRRK